MSTEDLTIDLSLHKELGMTVLTYGQVKDRKVDRSEEEWPEEDSFEPSGVTFEEAREAMKLCGG